MEEDDVEQLSRRSWQKVEVDETMKKLHASPIKSSILSRRSTGSFRRYINVGNDLENVKLKISIGGTEEKQYNTKDAEIVSLSVPRHLLAGDEVTHKYFKNNSKEKTKLQNKVKDELLWRIYDDPYIQNNAFDTLLTESSTGVENFEMIQQVDKTTNKTIIEVKKKQIKIPSEVKEALSISFFIFVLPIALYVAYAIQIGSDPKIDIDGFEHCSLSMPHWSKAIFIKSHQRDTKCNEGLYLMHNILFSYICYAGILFIAL